MLRSPRALEQRLPKPRLDAFTFDQAWHLYRLAFVDYARMVMCNFFKGASPAAFQAHAHRPNVGFLYRNVEASLHFLQQLDQHLRYVEELRGEQPVTTVEVSPDQSLR